MNGQKVYVVEVQNSSDKISSQPKEIEKKKQTYGNGLYLSIKNTAFQQCALFLVLEKITALPYQDKKEQVKFLDLFSWISRKCHQVEVLSAPVQIYMIFQSSAMLSTLSLSHTVHFSISS
jgi:hypothetical protein